MLQKFACFGILLAFAGFATAQAPSVSDGGVVNAASFSAPVAPGSLVSIFGSFTGATLADASSIPFSTSLGGVTSVTFDGIKAPLRDVIPTGAFPFINAQVPFGISTTSGTVNVAVTINGVTSAPKPVVVAPAAPALFTYPADGQSNAILIFVDPADGKVKIAAPPSAAISQVYPTAPIPRGTFGFFYATGLGATTPPVPDGTGGDPASPSTVYLVTSNPTVMIGGMVVTSTAAAQAPGFPGVYQINVGAGFPSNAPTGDQVPLQLQTLDGKITSSIKATVAIR